MKIWCSIKKKYLNENYILVSMLSEAQWQNKLQKMGNGLFSDFWQITLKRYTWLQTTPQQQNIPSLWGILTEYTSTNN